MDFALRGADVFDGAQLHRGQAVLVQGGRVSMLREDALPDWVAHHVLDGGRLMPGFIDLQVNGGAGIMFNDAPSVEGLERIARAHHALGTRAFLPTLITDTPAQTEAAIAAVMGAIDAGVPGIIGLHLEGPHLDVARKGAHDAGLIRAMDDADLAVLVQAAEALPNLMVTLAPEAVRLDQITALSQAGVIVSLGHTDCDYDTAMRAFEAGATCVTHLFNAMRQMGSRDPGLIGAALAAGVPAGIIADGVHVHPAGLGVAARAGSVFLVTDAMACAGSDVDSFTLNGREILREGGRLTLSDGTLAGADLNMARAIEVMERDVGDDAALERATSRAAGVLRDAKGFGSWPARIEDLIYLDAGYRVHAAATLA